MQKDTKAAEISSLGEQAYSEDSYEQSSSQNNSAPEQDSIVQLAKKVASETALVDYSQVEAERQQLSSVLDKNLKQYFQSQ